ncbi:hypothetical protein MKW94_026209 [Papaver nudicaule]|uniref:Uncharacterized protein n=1 Tax=Papaver nudicaule TaxID=74823 RepID=A0AA41VWF0_PAPNU|nr:hypothetical protein [Papaver nudicaule]
MQKDPSQMICIHSVGDYTPLPIRPPSPTSSTSTYFLQQTRFDTGIGCMYDLFLTDRPRKKITAVNVREEDDNNAENKQQRLSHKCVWDHWPDRQARAEHEATEQIKILFLDLRHSTSMQSL